MMLRFPSKCIPMATVVVHLPGRLSIMGSSPCDKDQHLLVVFYHAAVARENMYYLMVMSTNNSC